MVVHCQPAGALVWLVAALGALPVWAADEAQLARGRQLFQSAQPACQTCHTLQAADAHGQIGPVLDELQPDSARVLRALRSGIGLMPSYAERLSEDDLQAVAAFVAHATRAKSP